MLANVRIPVFRRDLRRDTEVLMKKLPGLTLLAALALGAALPVAAQVTWNYADTTGITTTITTTNAKIIDAKIIDAKIIDKNSTMAALA